ncbi:MAG: HAMP domain-containing protein [Rhodospirillales bacterium]|nr:HAMP domain-containing protein [Alphaproteobacteria bacterium]USO03507.1 MAG: HAMP domain-containing protein [Rhodospirillales bacterium]
MSWNVIKKMLPRTLFGRSLLILATPILLTQVITTYIFFDRHWERMTDRLAYAVAGEIEIIADQIEQTSDPETISQIGRYFGQGLDFRVSFQEGAQLQSQNQTRESWASVVAKTLSRAIEAQVRRPYDIRIDITEKWVEIALQLKNGVLVVVTPQRRLFSSSAYIFLLWMIGTSVVLLAISVLFMRNQIRPIRRLAIAAERFGKGRDVPFFKIEGAKEVRQAARAFLEMRERIDRQIQQRTAMLAGVSHDLRTPLTRMKLQLEMLGDGQDVRDLKGDIADMERMISAYLDFARGEGVEAPERTNIRDVLERVVAASKREGAKVNLAEGEDLFLVLRPVAFERCFSNLIGNAGKYAKECWVSAQRKDDHIEVLIEDDGPGIAPGLRGDVFKPFFRGEGSRNQKTGGVGLGLPIAQDIILSHGGQIRLEDSSRGGLKVGVYLPV